MATGYNQADFAVNLPSVFGSPADAARQNIAMQERERIREFERQQQAARDAERKRLQDEADLYKKTMFIQQYTDIDKYPTPDLAARDIVAKRLSDVKTNYLNLIKQNPNIDFATLADGINRDIFEVSEGAAGLKQEFEIAKSLIEKKKKDNPDIDAELLERDIREDVLERRIIRSDGKFVPNFKVPESKLIANLDNPDVLSKYVKTNKYLLDILRDAKGATPMKVNVGDFRQNIPYSGSIPSWRTPSFTPEDLKKLGGFLPAGTVPEAKIKSEEIPASAIPAAGGKPLKMITEDVYNNFIQDERVKAILPKLARTIYPNYDSMDERTKNMLKRNALYRTIEATDVSGFYPGEPNRAPVTRINVGGSSSKNQTVDFVQRFKKATEQGTSDDMVEVIREMYAGNGSSKLIDAKVDKDNKGIRITTAPIMDGVVAEELKQDEFIKPNDPNFYYKIANIFQRVTGSNAQLEGNIFKGKADYKKDVKPKTYQYKGKTYTESQLEAAAKQSGMTLAEYKKELKLQ